MSFDVRIERLLDTTPETAFDRWVDPVFMSRWYAPQEGWVAEAASDARVGGAWSATFGPAGGERWREHGVYTEVDRPHRLEYTCIFTFPDGRSFETRVTVTFEARDGKTLLTLVDAGFPSEEMRNAHQNGWPGFIDAFERTLTAP
jgi:uncharacterized protein YndB with AHSA1/START domain